MGWCNESCCQELQGRSALQAITTMRSFFAACRNPAQTFAVTQGQLQRHMRMAVMRCTRSRGLVLRSWDRRVFTVKAVPDYESDSPSVASGQASKSGSAQ